MGVNQLNIDYLSKNINKIQHNDFSSLEILLDPLFKEKEEEEILKNMSLLNEIVINKNNLSSSLLMNYEGLPEFIGEINNNGFSIPDNLYSFTNKCDKISSYFNIASKLPYEYHDTVIEAGYTAIELFEDSYRDSYSLEKDIALAMGFLSFSDNLEGFKSLIRTRLEFQEQYKLSFDQNEDYLMFDDFDDDFEDYEEFDDYDDFEAELNIFTLNDFKNFARRADYSRYNLCDFYVENIFPVGKTENMLYSQPVLELFINNR